jgi:two-component system, sensor histidine kinase and response regulator
MDDIGAIADRLAERHRRLHDGSVGRHARSMAECLLLVDDEPGNLRALEALLAPCGYRLVRAPHAAVAMVAFERERPDLVICDLVMPDLDGVALLGLIRAHAHRSHTPVILVTAYTEREHRLRALRSGADEFLEKPIDHAILLARVNLLLRLKQSRDALVEQNRALQQAHREQRELTEFVVHDVKTPLGTLRAGLGQLRDGLGRGPAALEPILSRVDAAARRLSGSLEDLLWISRLEHDSFPVFRRPVALDDALRRMVERFAPTARAAAVELSLAAPNGVTLSTDERLVGRVLENLLDNAVRYTPSGGRIHLELRAHDDVELLVSNDGPTIPGVERERIFQKFVRGAMDSPCPGHPGIGLYFCRRAVEALDGDVRVTDVAGWRTSFSVRLPVVARAHPP